VSKYKVALNHLIAGTQLDVLYQVIPRDKVKREARHTKTFVVLLADDSTAQDPNNIMPFMKCIVDCNAEVLFGCFVNYTCYATPLTSPPPPPPPTNKKQHRQRNPPAKNKKRNTKIMEPTPPPPPPPPPHKKKKWQNDYETRITHYE